MKLSLALAAALMGSSALAQAQEGQAAGYNGLAVQAVIATGGTLGMGLSRYTNNTEIGFSVSGTADTANAQTKLFVPVLYAGWRKALREKTYFSAGLDLLGKYGRDAGQAISADYQAGPYVSLEQVLTSHILLNVWVDPYNYEYKSAGGVSTSTNRFFATGGLGLSYLFF